MVARSASPARAKTYKVTQAVRCILRCMKFLDSHTATTVEVLEAHASPDLQGSHRDHQRIATLASNGQLPQCGDIMSLVGFDPKPAAYVVFARRFVYLVDTTAEDGEDGEAADHAVPVSKIEIYVRAIKPAEMTSLLDGMPPDRQP